MSAVILRWEYAIAREVRRAREILANPASNDSLRATAQLVLAQHRES